jgi:hypothetical protein
MVLSNFHCFAVFPWASSAVQSENEQFSMDEKSHRCHCNCATWSFQCCGHGKYSPGNSCTLIASFFPGCTVYSTSQHMNVLGRKFVETD